MSVTESALRERLCEVLVRRGDEIADRWVRQQVERVSLSEGLAQEDLHEEADALVAALRRGMASELPTDRVVASHQELREAVVDMSMRRARAGSSPTATSLSVLALKDVLLEAAQQESLAADDMLAAALLLNRLLDAAGALCFETYVEGREEIIRRQSRQLLEVSTPVVRLWRHVLAVPLVGTLDTARSQVVMETLLEAIQQHEATVAIIDITGVPTVDTSVAQHLMQTVQAVRMMGADCVISGIRPAIAQTIVQLGIDLSDILTRANLADALATAVRLTGEDGTGTVSGPLAAPGAPEVRAAP
ncbi:STAS domain-containing protein [Streptomyces qinglanensis]|uniref:RsbT co-antagonist protein RsbR n=1 Tax=Streptomyces qinglanensis TaxID=943816 RepID=A0A1H9SAY1_9ACTN|nr:STAS domain-containing protein [Streptomyces qinglanensis]SER81725.1 rsbT co-antagonist protein RsbR [Streptomyces qinglanensis]